MNTDAPTPTEQPKPKPDANVNAIADDSLTIDGINMDTFAQVIGKTFFNAEMTPEMKQAMISLTMTIRNDPKAAQRLVGRMSDGVKAASNANADDANGASNADASDTDANASGSSAADAKTDADLVNLLLKSFPAALSSGTEDEARASIKDISHVKLDAKDFKLD
jgi:hypothetical protein